MKCKRILIFTLVFSILFSSVFFTKVDAIDLTLNAKSAILMDMKSGTIVFEKNIDEKLPPASITKIMTLLLAMEALEDGIVKLEDTFTVSPHTAGLGGTQLYLEAGEVQTFENMLKATVIRSANDASVALAEFLAGSEELFVARMNERAKELGMVNTNFANASGLPDDNLYSTAYDIALMSKKLLENKKIHEYLTVYTDEIRVGKNGDVIQALVNTNKLINNYDGITGLKTGYTREAGHCISASARRGNLELIAVTLAGETSTARFNDAATLLDYGFANYDSITIAKKGDILGKVKVNKGQKDFVEFEVKDDSHLFLEKGQGKNISKEIDVEESVNSPVKKGDILGKLIVKIDENEIERIDLVAKEDCHKAGFKILFLKSLRRYLFIN